MKIGILTTHPIQYQAPWFRVLAAEAGVDLTVFFCLMPNAEQQGVGFGQAFDWDIPLLDGYEYRVLENVARRPAMSTFSGCDSPEIARIVRMEGFDVFVALGWQVKSYIQLLIACRRYGVPCIVRGESNDLRPRPFWKRMAHRLLLAQYDAILYIGESNRRFYLSSGVPEEKLFNAPYCVENERFESAAKEWRTRRSDIREGWGIPAGATVFLYCGKFIAKKRPMDSLAALRAALDSTTGGSANMHLLMVGSGELLEACRAEADRHRLPITFTGFLNQSEIAMAYAAADCLVLPSDDGETWGLVVNEAMACGLPAIVSDRVGCHGDLITPGETGYVFGLGDTNALGELMARLAANPERLRTMGTNAKKKIEPYCYAEVVRGTMKAAEAVRAVSRARRPPA